MTLRVIEGGRGARFVRVRVDRLEEMHAELTVSRAERLTFASQALQATRAIQRAVSDGRLSLAGTWADQLERAAVRERDRAFAVDRGPCPCGCRGDATADELAVPGERAA